jgi:hypothetical protein
MKRRTLLQSLAALPAAGLVHAQQPVVPPKPVPAATQETIPIVEATIPDMAGTTLLTFFTREQFAVLRRLSDLICPAINDVPGALAASAPEFLDFLIDESPEDRQKIYINGLDELDRQSKQRFGIPFAETNQTQADAILAPLCRRWTATGQDEFTEFLRTAKQDILAATQNSHEWIGTMSKRVRSAGGLGMYWYPIE